MWNGGSCDEQNELSILEFIHCYVETLEKFFGNVVCVLVDFVRLFLVRIGCIQSMILFECVLQIMLNLERCHFILDEMVTNGEIVDTNVKNITKPLELMEKARAKC